jgi:hypothetical protein
MLESLVRALEGCILMKSLIYYTTEINIKEWHVMHHRGLKCKNLPCALGVCLPLHISDVHDITLHAGSRYRSPKANRCLTPRSQGLTAS